MQITEQGQTLEEIEAFSQFMDGVKPFLEQIGWCWQDVKDSYARINMLPNDQRQHELVM